MLIIIAPGFVTVPGVMQLDKYLLYSCINEAEGHLLNKRLLSTTRRKNGRHTADINAEWAGGLRGRRNGLLPYSHSPKLTRAALGTSFASLSFPRMTPAVSSSWSIQVLIGHHLCATRKLLSTEIL